MRVTYCPRLEYGLCREGPEVHRPYADDTRTSGILAIILDG